MFHQLLFIHLYRPFLKHTKPSQSIPSPATARKVCSQAAFAISEILQIYRDTYGLRYICNVAVYTVHSACTIHLLSLPEKAAGTRLINGLRGLEEIADGWPCARRALRIIDLSAAKWGIGLPDEAEEVMQRSYSKFGSLGAFDHMRSADGRRLATINAVPQHIPRTTMAMESVSLTPFTSSPAVTSAPYDTTIQQQNQYQTSFPLPLSGTAPDAHQLVTMTPSDYTNEPPFNAYQNTSSFPIVTYVPTPTYTAHTWNSSSATPSINTEQRSQNNNDALDTSLPIKAATMQGEQQLAGSSNYWWLNDQAAFAYRLESQRVNVSTPNSNGQHVSFGNSHSGMNGCDVPSVAKECPHDVTLDTVKLEKSSVTPTVEDINVPMNYHTFGYFPNYFAGNAGITSRVQQKNPQSPVRGSQAQLVCYPFAPT